MADRLDVVLAEHHRAIEDRQLLVDIRFKLLVFVPTVTTIAAAVSKEHPSSRLAVSLVGLVTTFAVVIYEIRNTQLHDLATHTVNMIRLALGWGDVFPYRPAATARHKLFRVVPVQHDLALALIYGVCIAAWTGLALVSVTEFLTSAYTWAEKVSSSDFVSKDGGAEGTRWLAVLLSILAGFLTGKAIMDKNQAYKKELGSLETAFRATNCSIDAIKGQHWDGPPSA